MIEADLVVGRQAAAATTTGAVASMAEGDSTVPGDQFAGTKPPSKNRLAPPPVLLPDDDFGLPGTTQAPAGADAAEGSAAAITSLSGTPVSASAGAGTPSFLQPFAQQQQQQQQRPPLQPLQAYAGASAVSPPPSNLPQPSSAFASGSSRKSSPAPSAGAAASTPAGAIQLGYPALDLPPNGSVKGPAQSGLHAGPDGQSTAQQLLSSLPGGADRLPAQLPGTGGYGEVLPLPPSGLPVESHLFGNAGAGLSWHRCAKLCGRLRERQDQDEQSKTTIHSLQEQPIA